METSGSGHPETFSYTTSNVEWVNTQWIAILVCSKLAADLHCKSAGLQQGWHDKSASVKQACSKLTQASKSPLDELAASMS
ncbi:hypothetical protein AVEN_238156-1 [Araneus ventricosus]|uniref:Uncharacterized protein n=1 Tax=Araneus ventricosus TaxID=182803 RepID=A0A4Y2TSP0_ARAVE|nr:hypothetical protein AVEN_238156-1 [Araneus ventricosus]